MTQRKSHNSQPTTPQQPRPDTYAKQWHVTPLGRLIIVVMLIMVGAILVYSIRPVTADEAARRANLSATPAPAAQRLFTANDAVGFTQLAYDSYFKTLTADGTDLTGIDLPYDSNTMLEQLELMRSKLSDTTYKSLRANYTTAAKQGGIKRDEVACSQYDFSHVAVTLKRATASAAELTIARINDDNVVVGRFEATVDLATRQITSLHCL